RGWRSRKSCRIAGNPHTGRASPDVRGHYASSALAAPHLVQEASQGARRCCLRAIPLYCRNGAFRPETARRLIVAGDVSQATPEHAQRLAQQDRKLNLRSGSRLLFFVIHGLNRPGSGLRFVLSVVADGYARAIQIPITVAVVDPANRRPIFVGLKTWYRESGLRAQIAVVPFVGTDHCRRMRRIAQRIVVCGEFAGLDSGDLLSNGNQGLNKAVKFAQRFAFRWL